MSDEDLSYGGKDCNPLIVLLGMILFLSILGVIATVSECKQYEKYDLYYTCMRVQWGYPAFEKTN